MSVCQDLRSLGLNPFVTFAKTSGTFCPDEIAMFKELGREGVGTVLLTNRELEPVFPYEEKDKERGWKSFPQSIRELAENSASRYLR